MLDDGKDTMLQTRSTPPLDADEIEASAEKIPSLADALAVIEATEILADSPDGLDPFDDGDDTDDAFTAFLIDSLVVVS